MPRASPLRGVEFAKPDQRIGIAVLADVGENRDREFALVELIEQLHRADDLQPFDPAAAAARGAAQFDLRQTELGARQLAVIAGRLLGRAACRRARASCARPAASAARPCQ